ncbi:MAG: heavy metal-associated domain-containing protein [Chitinophagaceae bacterium]
MKQLFITLFLATGFAVTSFSQTKTIQTAKIKTPNALCEACKTRIETYLKRYNGLLSINVNIRRGETTVKYLTDRTNLEELKTAIANIGYDADDVTANEESYKRLPKTCKKPEDGGSHPKLKTILVADTVQAAN